jgi:hypothetical protein
MALSPLLVDAKKEYTHQLADLLAPYVMNTVARLFEASNKKQSAFRELLRQVPNWNASNIEERTNEIERRNPQLQDLIAACCVSYTKVLGSIRLSQAQNSNYRVSLPQSSTFVHGVYIHVAKEFFYNPKLVYATRHEKIELLRDAVDESIRQHVPISQLLKAYLSVAVDESGMDPMAAAPLPAQERYTEEQQQQQQQPMYESPQNMFLPQYQAAPVPIPVPVQQQPVYYQMSPPQPVVVQNAPQQQFQEQPQPQPQQPQQPQHQDDIMHIPTTTDPYAQEEQQQQELPDLFDSDFEGGAADFD